MTEEKQKSRKRSASFRLIGYGIVHLILVLMITVFREYFEGTRLFPLALPFIAVGPLVIALEVHFKFLRKT